MKLVFSRTVSTLMLISFLMCDLTARWMGLSPFLLETLAVLNDGDSSTAEMTLVSPSTQKQIRNYKQIFP